MVAKRPVGDITRGTTNPNRLRRVDRWILHAVCPVIRSSDDPLIVDLGYGASPVTTVELANRLAAHVRPDCRVIGIEIDPVRVSEAQPLSREGLSFQRGGFEVPVAGQPILIRAFNVLRQYDESDVQSAWSRMLDRVAPQGFLVEGTCDEIGRHSTWIALRPGLGPVSLSLSAQVDSLDRPSVLAERLPKALIHRNVPGERIHTYLEAFDRAWDRASPLKAFSARQRWIAAVQELKDSGWPIADSINRWRLGEVTVAWSAVSPDHATE